MKKITIIALFAALGMVSCKDTKAEATENPATETAVTTGETATPVADSHEGHDHSSHAGHDHGTDVASSAAEGMNPPHGQPGHRCDIPVGAPLNSPPAQTNQQASTPAANQGGFLGSGNAQTSAPVQQAAPAQQTAPGMQGKPNPAHGQPGHRCDVQVGQPLP